METPVLVLGRGCAVLIRIAPWKRLDSGSVSCCCFFGQNSGLLNEALRGGLYNRGMGG